MALRIADHDKKKKEKLIDREMQTSPQDYSEKEKNESRIRQLATACQKLNNEL
jgi:hypothetical protein